ncbi:hypothetical protein [Krasilnikovia sp. M28-CT-15]|uniref:hypothetical protein n=1 Tax=Krasilnikovia sp. M28-CT-15 TaxID=3373540 RepID=UPI003875B2D9
MSGSHALAVAASVVSVLAAAGLELNRLTETYPTWGALAGSPPAASEGLGARLARRTGMAA